jgi:hypothetical protein
MLPRRLLVVAVLTLLSTHRMVGASPITYDFTGTLNQPVDGSKTFSGSLTINAIPTPAEMLGGGVAEDGTDVSLTVRVGGQVLNFINTPQNPNSVSFQAGVTPPNDRDFMPSVATFLVGGMNWGNTGNGPTSSFAMNIYSPPGVESLPANLADVSLVPNTSSVRISDSSGGSSQDSGGGLTSIEIVSSPEPSTLVVFAGLGIAVLVYRRHRLPRDRSAV